MPRHLISVCAVALTLAVAAAGPASAIDAVELKKQLVAKSAKIQKGMKDLALVQTMAMKGEGGQTVTHNMTYYKMGNKYRQETEMRMPPNPNMPPGMENMTTIIIFDGKEKWSISAISGKQKMGAGGRGDDESPVDMLDMSAALDMKVIGSEKVDGRDCHVIESREGGSVSKVWLDRKSLVHVKVVTTTPGEKPSEAQFSDFRDVGGLFEWPYKSTITGGGGEAISVVVKSIKVNSGLSPALFDAQKTKIPAGPDMQKMMQEMMKQHGR